MSDERIIDLGHTQLLASRLAGVRTIHEEHIGADVQVLQGGAWASVLAGVWVSSDEAEAIQGRIERAMVGSTGGAEFERVPEFHAAPIEIPGPVSCPACFRPRSEASVSGSIDTQGEGSTSVVCPCGHVYREVEHRAEPLAAATQSVEGRNA